LKLGCDFYFPACSAMTLKRLKLNHIFNLSKNTEKKYHCFHKNTKQAAAKLFSTLIIQHIRNLKEHVTLKTEVMVAKNSALP